MGFCCECRAPKRLRYVPPIIIFGIIIWLYTTFVRHAQPLIFAKGGSKVEIGLFHVLVFLLCASLIQCLLSKGSFLNCEIKTDPKKQAVELKFNGERRFCRKCKASKPDRTHHCSSCNRCVLKMDHHCVYINK
jgi:palmitoyltransferase